MTPKNTHKSYKNDSAIDEILGRIAKKRFEESTPKDFITLDEAIARLKSANEKMMS